MTTIDPETLRQWLGDGEELALLDVREEMVFGQSHILYASCLPLSRLELKVDALAPRRSVRLALCDGGEGLSERAAARLTELGYTDVNVLEGGTKAWKNVGFELFSGVNVPSKAFGEIVEHEYGTPSVSADELKARLDAGEDLVILDSRPFVEYAARNIPGGICTPGGELVYRVGELATSPGTQVVVNCAGRTRSIIGAQSLINAGIPNPVVALRNGTMGWHLAGHALETGSSRRAPDPKPDTFEVARERAEAVAKRYGVRRIGMETLQQFQNERDQRSLFVLDVRHPEEYEAGHLRGSRSAPGGQLVQETDQFVGTLDARVVLVDDTRVRAIMTASWLVQMGWEAYVLEGALDRAPLETGPEPVNVLGLDDLEVDEISPGALDELMDGDGPSVIDVSTSRKYREGHVPGAWFVIRARFPDTLPTLDPGESVVVTSEDGVLARLAAPEVAASTGADVKVLAGGTAAWRDSGLPLESGETRMADPADDIWLRPYEKDWGVEQAMQDYLTWEVALVEQIERDGTARFRRRAEFE
ncbi:MAG: rhodanese-like domain-containing protein [Gammaproteobacteria bacterium]|nr:rhodanese-like domain-containing protein [Gammaproteobacteria bacterium]